MQCGYGKFLNHILLQGENTFFETLSRLQIHLWRHRIRVCSYIHTYVFILHADFISVPELYLNSHAEAQCSSLLLYFALNPVATQSARTHCNKARAHLPTYHWKSLNSCESQTQRGKIGTDFRKRWVKFPWKNFALRCKKRIEIDFELVLYYDWASAKIVSIWAP